MAYKRKRSGAPNRAGYERAKKHIEDAERLTEELGGTDTDVKNWFFSLSPNKRSTIFKKYGQKYGPSKEEYARIAYPRWKSGRKRMSGLVAERLFNLLPPMMPAKDKLSLVESLWKHVGPEKKILIIAGTESSTESVIDHVEEEVSKLTTDWVVPDQMVNRFKWLAQNDSGIYQKLLAHIEAEEKKLGQAVLKDHIPKLKTKFKNDISDTTSRLSYIIDVGNQMVELRMEGSGENVDIVDWYPAGSQKNDSSTSGSFVKTVLIVAAVMLAFYLFVVKG